MPLWGFAISFLCAALWAASPIMVSRGMAISGCTGYEITPIRSIAFFVTALIMALTATRGHITLVTDPITYFYLFMSVGLSYVIGDACYFAAMSNIGISLAIPICNAYPIFMTLTSWVILGETATKSVFIGIAIVVAGVIVLHIGTDDDSESPMDKTITPAKSRIFRGFIFAVAAGLAWAIGGPFTKLAILRSGLGAIELTFYRSLVLLIFVWTWRFIQLRYTYIATIPLATVPRVAWLYFMGAAVIGLSIGSVLYALCIRAMPVAIVTAITSTSPFMSALYGHFVMKDRLTPLMWFGVGVIIVGSVFISF